MELLPPATQADKITKSQALIARQMQLTLDQRRPRGSALMDAFLLGQQRQLGTYVKNREIEENMRRHGVHEVMRRIQEAAEG